MRLSEAMRLGAMVGPQAFNVTFNGDGSCALGAAIRAAGCPVVASHGVVINAPRPGDTGLLAEVPAAWMRVLQMTSPCPACDTTAKVYRLVAHLNDTHRWTREQIAEWVESQEALGEPVAADAVGQRSDARHLATRA